MWMVRRADHWQWCAGVADPASSPCNPSSWTGQPWPRDTGRSPVERLAHPHDVYPYPGLLEDDYSNPRRDTQIEMQCAGVTQTSGAGVGQWARGDDVQCAGVTQTSGAGWGNVGGSTFTPPAIARQDTWNFDEEGNTIGRSRMNGADWGASFAPGEYRHEMDVNLGAHLGTSNQTREIREYNAGHTAVTATRAVAYEKNGNLQPDWKHRYTYDGLNRLTRVEVNVGTVSVPVYQDAAKFAYDAMGHRTRATLADAGSYIGRPTDYMVYDHLWRVVAVVRKYPTGSGPSALAGGWVRERYVYHQAGFNGRAAEAALAPLAATCR